MVAGKKRDERRKKKKMEERARVWKTKKYRGKEREEKRKKKKKKKGRRGLRGWPSTIVVASLVLSPSSSFLFAKGVRRKVSSGADRPLSFRRSLFSVFRGKKEGRKEDEEEERK